MPVMAVGNSAIHSPVFPGPLLNVVCTGPTTGTVVALTTNVGPTTVSVAVFDVPPPGAGVNTVTFNVPPVAMSPASTVAVSDVTLPNVVVRALPFTCTTEFPAKSVPVMVSVKAAPPAATLVGLIVVIVGTAGGGVTLSVAPLDVHTLATHGVGLTTLIVWLVPAVVTSLAGRAAVSCVAVPNVVGRTLPSTCTIAPFTNPAPVTVNVNAALPAAMLAGLIAVMTGVGLMFATSIDELAESSVNPLLLNSRNS
jgi:hypothetical protein